MEEGFQIRRVAVKILNKRRGQPIRGGTPGWGLGVVLTTRHSKKVISYEVFQSSSDLEVYRTVKIKVDAV
jgi:hypothetical protein